MGLLAYGAIGDEHNQAIKATPGLSLAAVCDTNPERLKVALAISPDAKTFTDADQMIASGDVDLVVILFDVFYSDVEVGFILGNVF